MIEAMLIVLGAAVALVSATVTEVVRDRLGRAQRRRERRDDFQHQDLRELQDETVRLVRAATAVYFEGLRLYDEATIPQQLDGVVPTTELFRENRRLFWDADFRIDVLRERIDDDRLRQEAEGLQRLGRVLATRPAAWFRQQRPDDTRDELRDMINLYRRLNQGIGLILRNGVDVPQRTPAPPGATPSAPEPDPDTPTP